METNVDVAPTEIESYIQEKIDNRDDVPGWEIGGSILNTALENPDSIARKIAELMWLVEDEIETDAELGFQNTTTRFEEHGTHLFCGFYFEDVDDNNIRFKYGTTRRLAASGLFVGGYRDGKIYFDHKDFSPDTDVFQTEISLYGEADFVESE